MKKFLVIFLIFFLILFTAIVKNSTKRVDDDIFIKQEIHGELLGIAMIRFTKHWETLGNIRYRELS